MFSGENVVCPNTSGMKLVWQPSQPDDRKVNKYLHWFGWSVWSVRTSLSDAALASFRFANRSTTRRESSASRMDDVNESPHQRPLQPADVSHWFSSTIAGGPDKSNHPKTSGGGGKRKQNEKNASLFFFLSLIMQPDRPEVSRPPWLSARTHSQLRLDRAFSVHGLIQANCAGDNRRRKKSEPGRAEILEPACASHRMTGALGMRPQQGSAVSSDNSSGYQ